MLVKFWLRSLPAVDPFSDLDTMLGNSISYGKNLDSLCGMTEDEIAVGYSRIEKYSRLFSDY